MLAKEIKPGVTTLHLDRLAEAFIRDHGAEPGFLGLYDFPNTLCVSPNEEVVHGIPNNKPLEEGDILSVDCGALKNGFYGDHAYTFELGTVGDETKDRCSYTSESRYVMLKPSQSSRNAGRSYYGLLKAPYSNLLLKSRPRRLRGRIACDGLAITRASQNKGTCLIRAVHIIECVA